MSAISVIQIIRWPFLSRFASPVWLLLRFYLASVWFQFGWAKIQGGWLTENPLRPLLSAVAAGHTPAPFPVYAQIAGVIVSTGIDELMSVAIPLFEVAVAIAFVSGVFLVPAACAAILLNLNLILAGIASLHFDGRIIALQVLLVLAWRVAGFIGLGTLASRGFGRHRTRASDGSRRHNRGVGSSTSAANALLHVVRTPR